METFDLASELEQKHTEAAIAAVRSKAGAPTMPYNGVCYYCEEHVPSPRVFCDAQCRDDWEYERARLRANAKR